MNDFNGKRLMNVLSVLMKNDHIPSCVGEFIKAVTEEYGFDRVRTYIKVPGEYQYQLLHSVRKGEDWKIYTKEQQIDLSRSYYPRKNDEINKMGIRIFKDEFIYTEDFTNIIEDMEGLGYVKDHINKTTQACIACIQNADENLANLGYIVFEKFDKDSTIGEIELSELKNLCKICSERVIRFETGKQLRIEEVSKTIDDLTSLYTLEEFREQTKYIFEENKPVTFLYLDVDKFKYINEMWGFEIGNKVLCRISDILIKFITGNEKVCRIAADKFGVALHFENKDEMRIRLNLLNEAFTRMQKQEFPNIKIAVITGVFTAQEEISVNVALDKANIARRAIKGSYKNIYHCYNSTLEEYTEQEKELEARMVDALENREFRPFLQPKFSMDTEEIVGAEALARWIHEDGMISPQEFIPIFENNGFITRMDFAIYEEVFRFIKNQITKGRRVFPISVNVSREHLDNPNFINDFNELMRQYGVKPEMIEIEITESVFAKDKEALKKFIGEIRALKIPVSIDDFGTAYSSLNLLNEVSIDVIKMDKSFIDNVVDVNSELSRDKVVIRNILNMISELSMKTVFEGVETSEQIHFLKEVGCKYGQGYYFDRPLPLEVFEEKYYQ